MRSGPDLGIAFGDFEKRPSGSNTGKRCSAKPSTWAAASNTPFGQYPFLEVRKLLLPRQNFEQDFLEGTWNIQRSIEDFVSFSSLLPRRLSNIARSGASTDTLFAKATITVVSPVANHRSVT